jgi:hypothetical protein
MEREQQVSMCSQFDQVQDRVDEGNFHDHTFSALRSALSTIQILVPASLAKEN